MMKCLYCGTDNPAGEKFCNNCGGYLDVSAGDATVTTGASPQIAGGHSGSSGSETGSSLLASGSGSGEITSTLVPESRLENGRYVVEKVLGQGGMGAAVLARDTRVSNKKVVIKELISDQTDPEQWQEDVRNFEREVETLAGLDHPLIPTVTDSFQEDSSYYMVQEYAAGENLEDYMERIKRPMGEQEALTYTAQVLDILDYLSRQKPPIVHRDIKPANIIVSARDKRARLVDFGIARADASNTQRKQTAALGTPGYAPPEQYQGKADARSDLYALAATLHHVLTNRDPREYAPFTYPAVHTVNPRISPETERLLERALTMDITKRYQNAAAMRHDIDDILSQRFHSTENNSSYLLGGESSRKPAPLPGNRSGTAAAARPVQAAGAAGQSGYQQGYRQQPPATPLPPYMAESSYQSEPPYRSPQAGQRSQQQQQMGMYAPYPGQQGQQNGGNSYVFTSFIMLMIVLVIIGALLYFAPLLSQAGFGF